MAWNPETYLSFEAERTRPAAELLARVPGDEPNSVVDLGCGPGNSTALLAARWPDANITGIDSSPSMIAKARSSGVRAEWMEADLVSWSPGAAVDVLFANAVFQWLEDHEKLLPRLMGCVAEGGVLAFQVPRNFEDASHVLLKETVQSGPWAGALEGVRSSGNVASPAAYFSILETCAARIDIWETQYLHVLEGEDAVYRWVGGTALRPYEAALAGDEREAFLTEYRRRLRAAYPKRASGTTLFPFRPLFVVAQRSS